MVKTLPAMQQKRSPAEGNGNPLHYSCLKNPMDRGACHMVVVIKKTKHFAET